MLREMELTQYYMILGQKSDCLLCMQVVHHFQKDTPHSAVYFITLSSPVCSYRVHTCTQNDDVIADS